MSHLKPTLGEALESVTNQTRSQDMQIVVVDSGAWMDADVDTQQKMYPIYKHFSAHPLVDWYFTGEPKNARELYCPVSHWSNLAFRQGLVRGKYVCFFYDDDIYYPTFIEKMAGYLDANPSAMAVRCTEARTVIYPDGRKESTPQLVADRVMMGGENMDCVVDGMQVMLRKEVINEMIHRQTSGDVIDWELYPETPDWNSCSHSDGIFFNKMTKVIDKLHIISEVLCEHRSTQYSTFTPSK